MTPDTDLFKRGMRRLAAGVSIITTCDESAGHGMVATSVCSVSADPPTLLVCVNRTATCHGAIRAAGFFCVNLLTTDDDALARRFSTPADRDARFHGRDWATLATGAPALVGALASFDCEIREALDVDSHTIFVGRVNAIELWQDAVDPLVYADGRFDRLVGCRVKDACA
jgi:flavin reductase